MTAGPGARVAALLELLRPTAAEILVALDDRAEASVLRELESVADRVVLYPFAEPVDRPLPWLFAQCAADWALVLDDDEIPSVALQERLPDLCADESVGHYSLPRRWLFPDTSTYLDDSPWRPDYALRLLRTDPRAVRFSAEFHRPIVATGPGRFLAEPIWHVDPLLRTFEQRLEKARRYERTRPGLRVGGRALNFAFYLPELRAAPALAPVPPEERARIEAVLAGTVEPAPRRARLGSVSRAELDAAWPAPEAGRPSGRLELLERPLLLRAGEYRTVDLRVQNTGAAAWPWGADCPPRIRVASRWYRESGEELAEQEVWSTFPAALQPRAAAIVPVHVNVPEVAGHYRVVLDLVEYGVGRLDAAVAFDVNVGPRRRIAVIGDDGAVESIVSLLEAIPELEPVVLRRSPRDGAEGYPEVADLRPYLLADAGSFVPFVAAILCRSVRLAVAAMLRRLGLAPTLPHRAGDLLEVLHGCELLAVAGMDGPDERRERWAVGITARAASSLGVPVAVRRGLPYARGVVFEDAGELLQLLAARR